MKLTTKSRPQTSDAKPHAPKRRTDRSRPSRIEHIGDATLYLGDCLQVLPFIAGINAVVTDPPYNVGYRYASYPDNLPPDLYLAWLKQCFEACATAGASQLLFTWQGIRVANGELPVCLPTGWTVHHLCAWMKREFAGDRWGSNHPAYAWEPIIWASRPGCARYAGPRGGHAARDALLANHHRHDGDWGHPCKKTLSVVRTIVNWLDSEAIADPWMGSGTTGVAALEAGKKFIGCEIDPGYFERACERIAASQKQMRLGS